MAQHDYVLDNQSGAAFRADLNNALSAVVSQNSGTTAPSTTFAHMIWVDTSGGTPVIKIRNAANSAWVTIGNAADYLGLLPGSNGMVARTAAGTTAARTITGTTNVITVTNGDGASGNPTLTVGSLVARTDTAQSFSAGQRGTISALGNSSGTITLDMATANNFSLTLNANSTNTLANPTNQTAGQSGIIVITQDATGSRTLAYGSYWKFPSGTAPTLTTTASAVDVLAYYVESTTRITARLVADVK